MVVGATVIVRRKGGVGVRQSNLYFGGLPGPPAIWTPPTDKQHTLTQLGAHVNGEGLDTKADQCYPRL